MMKSAFLGCGPRAAEHAMAYRHVRQGTIGAICDIDRERLDAFGDRFDIAARYTDLEIMLTEEKPDLLHIVTSPRVRLEPMQTASRNGVPAVIVEKPIAITGEDYEALVDLELASRTPSHGAATRFIVNTQLHYHPRVAEFRGDLASGRIGEIRFVTASSRLPTISQAPHVLQLVSAFLGFPKPVRVIGQVAGADNLSGLEHAPDNAAMLVTYLNGTQAQITLGMANAPVIESGAPDHMHKQVTIYGSEGYLRWDMFGWERSTLKDGFESGKHSYYDEDLIAQGAFTEAAFDWVADANKIHPTNLARSLSEFNIILGLYASAIDHTTVELPCEPIGDILTKLARVLA